MTIVSKLLQKAESEPGLHYRNPSIPHACSIPGGLSIGSKIYLHGMVPKDASQFAIALQRGADSEFADLHLNLVAKLGGSPVVGWNTRLQGSWGMEEQLPTPLSLPLYPRTFLLVLTAYMDAYEVEIIGSSNFSIKVRDGLPISAITHLAIAPQLTIRAIHIPVENMPRNLRLSLGSGTKVSDMFSIRGQPTEEAKSFLVSWQSGPAKYDDVLFQVSARLEEGRVVRNSRLDEVMGKEESDKEDPFQSGQPFKLQVLCSSVGFETRLDDKEWHSFKHRQDAANARTLFMEGDMQPIDIIIDSAQLTAPGTSNGINLKSRGVRLQQFYSELPLTSRITGGFDKGCILLISGVVNSHPSRMQMTVQCGEGSEDSDVALQYLVQWEDDGSSKVTLNSCEEETWGQEVKSNPDEGLYPGLPFDLLVARSEDGFRCFLGSIQQAAFPYRIEDPMPNHVTLCGDVELQRLILL